MADSSSGGEPEVPGTARARLPSRLELIVLLGALTVFAPLATDMYLPALPTLEREFATSMLGVQATLATFFIGFAVGQIFFGPVTDRFGRRPPLYAGLLLFAAASFGCALAPSIEVLMGLRFVQAFGACAGGVISRAMVRDLFDSRESAKVYGGLMLVTGLAPMLAPLFGGYFLIVFGWQSIFVAMGLLGLLCLGAAHLRLPETHVPNDTHSLSFLRILFSYGRLLRHRAYLGFALTSSCCMGCVFAYIAGSPFVFIELYGVPAEQFGWFFGTNAAGFVVMAQINGRLVQRFSSQTLLRFGTALQLVAALGVLAAALTGAGGLWGLAVPLFLVIASIGLVLPNSAALAMAPHGAIAGLASALLGVMQFGAGGIVALSVGLLADHTALPMAAVIAASALGGFIFCRVLALASRSAPVP
jgi:DHA1 family bicyclomycin/chloramphenicol resistance-like MFS transporter